MEQKMTVIVDNLKFPEVPRWREDKLWFGDFFAHKVMHVDLQGHAQTVVELRDLPAGLGWTPKGQLLVVSALSRRLFCLENDGLVEVADLSSLVSYPCSDMVVDGQGRAYIGDIGFDFGKPDATFMPGLLLLVERGGSPRVVAEGLAFPNGMVITPDGQTLIVAESYAARLTAFTIEPDGSLSQRRIWAQFDERNGRVTPDGICLDAKGAVWAASPGTKEVLRTCQGGEITDQIPLDQIPLACMLGGPDRRTLFITSSESQDPTKARGRIAAIPVEVAGAGLP